jgi:hypothetical protein
VINIAMLSMIVCMAFLLVRSENVIIEFYYSVTVSFKRVEFSAKSYHRNVHFYYKIYALPA